MSESFSVSSNDVVNVLFCGLTGVFARSGEVKVCWATGVGGSGLAIMIVVVVEFAVPER
jgi:hypothetical protein